MNIGTQNAKYLVHCMILPSLLVFDFKCLHVRTKNFNSFRARRKINLKMIDLCTIKELMQT